MHSAQRTLVKSPPELWAEISDPAGLARRLEGFGEVRIARLEPETTVAWEGDRVRGTVCLEPAGWGTKVTLTAEVDQPPAPPEPEPEPVAVAEPEPQPEPEPLAEPEPERRRLLARLRSRWRRAPVAETPGPVPDPVPPPPDPAPPGPDPAPDPAPPQIAMDPAETVAALEAVLDDLGSAHHRPFSRA